MSGEGTPFGHLDFEDFDLASDALDEDEGEDTSLWDSALAEMPRSHVRPSPRARAE